MATDRTVNLNSVNVNSDVDKYDTLIGLSGGVLHRISDRAVFVKRPYVLDLNNATRTGIYTINANRGTTENLPVSGNAYGVLLVFEDDTREEEEFVQIAIFVSTTPRIFIRKKGSASGWSSWFSLNSTEISGGG